MTSWNKCLTKEAVAEVLDGSAERPIYRYTPPLEAGLNYRWWGPAAGPHLDPLEWSGPADYNGFPLPSASAPDFSGITTLTNITDSGTGAGAARYGIIDGWIYVPEGATVLRDSNGNTGEFGMVLLGSCCGDALVEQPGGNHGPAAGDAPLMDPSPVSEGWYYIYNPQSDFSAFQGLDLEWSADGTSWSNIAIMQPDVPVVESTLIGICDEIPEGWQLQPLPECCPSQYISGGGGVDVVPSTLVPIPDNEVDASIRTGFGGTTGEFSDAGHNHAIVRQTHPTDIVLTGNANAPISNQVVLDRRSTEEWVEWEIRVLVSLSASGGSWPIVTIPTLAGYQQPIIVVTNNYRTQTLTFQEEEQGNGNIAAALKGAAPVGPYMGIEWSMWSSTRNLYGPYRRENAYTQYISASITYVRL